MNTNVSGIPATLRRRAGACEAATARTRPDRHSVRRCGGAFVRALTTTITRHGDDTAVVGITGEIDVRTAQDLRRTLLAVADEGRSRIVVDFSGVFFCDATGLGALVAVNNRLRGRHGTVVLAGARPAQQRILRITRLDRLFPAYDDVETALSG